MGVRIFNCCVVLLTILYVSCGTIDAAAIKRGRRSLSAYSPAVKYEYWPVRAARQASSGEDSASDENDDDEVQAQEFAQQQQLAAALQDDSDEEEDGDGGDDDDDNQDDDDSDNDRRRRRRREAPAAEAEKIKQTEVLVKESESVAVPEPLPAPPATSEQTNAVKEPEPTESPNTATTATTAATSNISTPPIPSRNTSVLILIRDALKKVTTLPTEQVATNALQYFQLFEHFIQQTIEEVISDDDDDDEDETAAAAVAATTIKPDGIFTPEEEELIAGVEESIKEPELVTKQPLVEKPAETQVEGMANTKPIESIEFEHVAGQTKPVPGGPQQEGEQTENLAVVSETATVSESPTIKAPATISESAKLEPATNSV